MPLSAFAKSPTAGCHYYRDVARQCCNIISAQHHATLKKPACKARRAAATHVDIVALVQAAGEGIQQGGLAGPRGPQQQREPAGVQNTAHGV